MCQSELIHLAADLSFFHTDYLWRMPGSWSGYPYYSSPELYEDIARMASRGVIGIFCFLAIPPARLKNMAAITTLRSGMV